MESAPSSFYRVEPRENDPLRVDVTIHGNMSATFAYDPETGKVTPAGEFADSRSIDTTAAAFIGRNRLENAKARALAYFKERAAQEAAKKEAAPGPQYELDLGDQTLH